MAYLVADARALSAGQYQHIMIYGLNAISDGGGGFYLWDAAATNVDDGAAWIKPDSITHPAPGRWRRVWSFPVTASTTDAGLVELATDTEVATGTDTARAVTPAGAASRYQPLDADLTALAGLASAADKVPYFTGSAAASIADFTATGRGIAALGASTAPFALHGDITWKIPGERVPVTETAATRTNTVADRYQYVRFTNTGAKTPAVSGSIAAAGHVWVWANMAATGDMTLSGAGGLTLTGNLVFAPYRAASIVFTSATTADVIGGT